MSNCILYFGFGGDLKMSVHDDTFQNKLIYLINAVSNFYIIYYNYDMCCLCNKFIIFLGRHHYPLPDLE